MATYRFDVRRDRIVSHSTTLTVEADNIADAIEQVRRLDTRDADWQADAHAHWGDTLTVQSMTRTAPQTVRFLDNEAEPIGEMGLAWFKRQEAKADEVAA